MNAAAHSHLNVFTVEEYTREGETARSWTKIGVAFPHNDGLGFNIELKAFPRDGKLVVLPPSEPDAREAPADPPPPPARANGRSPERAARPPTRERRR